MQTHQRILPVLLARAGRPTFSRCAVALLMLALSGSRVLADAGGPACLSCSGLPGSSLSYLASVSLEWAAAAWLLAMRQQRDLG
ncbi:hypothetical protein SAMN05216359_102460 [Roseateles sp. YR242]|uniref:hypothetical protein n=1 Tax=Roseateles sp. YR242 TaxID=1855305 RepID=UPI0008BE9436|nr:hypothetical protein [Roseateles sp. YR242]SEK62919.1 hypothetical protein SAMN05216359_102460 [Roseateles sp. YR242]